MATIVWITRPEGVVWRRRLTYVTWGDFDNQIKERVKIGLSEEEGNLPGWLASRMREGDVELPSVECRSKTNVIEGVAKLTGRGVQTHQGPLTNWDEEGRLLLRMYHTPMDSCKVKVLEAARLKNPITITHRDSTQEGRSEPLKPVHCGSDMFKPILPRGADFTLEDDSSVQDQMVVFGVEGEHQKTL